MEERSFLLIFLKFIYVHTYNFRRFSKLPFLYNVFVRPNSYMINAVDNHPKEKIINHLTISKCRSMTRWRTGPCYQQPRYRPGRKQTSSLSSLYLSLVTYSTYQLCCLCVFKCPRWSIGCLRLHLVHFTLPSSFLQSTHKRHPIMMTSWHGNAVLLVLIAPITVLLLQERL